jgi:hypothetical protein
VGAEPEVVLGLVALGAYAAPDESRGNRSLIIVDWAYGVGRLV